MYIGLIAEGPADLAVIKNILKGKLSLDPQDIHDIQPELLYDETDLNDKRFSNWTLIKAACEKQTLFYEFFAVDEERYIVIHIDTAEAHLKNYDVKRPVKDGNPEYFRDLRLLVIKKINDWLKGEFSDQIFYAIAIEEIDAWVLTIYTDKTEDTGKYQDAKTYLEKTLNRKLSRKQKNVFTWKYKYDQYNKISKAFSKAKDLEKCVIYNESLRLFCDSLDRAKP